MIAPFTASVGLDSVLLTVTAAGEGDAIASPANIPDTSNSRPNGLHAIVMMVVTLKISCR
jgi:hypothetical protein